MCARTAAPCSRSTTITMPTGRQVSTVCGGGVPPGPPTPSSDHAFTWGVQAEDLPEESNRIILDPEVTDSDGLPAVRTEYRVSENSGGCWTSTRRGAVEAAEAAGAVETSVSPIWPTGISHILGTTRMGDDSSSSVVDRWCRAHDVPNLYIVRRGVFVTAGSANPTATIMANTLRVVERMIEQRRHQESAV